MKELLDQHAQQGKSHHVFLDRDLILQPQSERNKEVQATGFKKMKTEKANKIQLQPALKRQLPSETSQIVYRWHKGESGFLSTAGHTASDTWP